MEIGTAYIYDRRFRMNYSNLEHSNSSSKLAYSNSESNLEYSNSQTLQPLIVQSRCFFLQILYHCDCISLENYYFAAEFLAFQEEKI